MRIDSAMRPRSSSSRHNTSASITVTVTDVLSHAYGVWEEVDNGSKMDLTTRADNDYVSK